MGRRVTFLLENEPALCLQCRGKNLPKTADKNMGSHPLKNWAYELAQRFSGSEELQKIFHQEILSHSAGRGLVLDVGGGTGLYRLTCPPAWKYQSLDCDRAKIYGFKQRHPQERAIQGSATHLPMADKTFDLCLMIFIAHHLSPADLQAALREITRVLRQNGRLFLADPVWNPANWRGRCLWALDQGAYKKTAAELSGLIGGIMEIVEERSMRILHDYKFFWCRRRT